jgi:hypothetical protein
MLAPYATLTWIRRAHFRDAIIAQPSLHWTASQCPSTTSIWWTMTLIHSALAGGGSIDDCDALRADASKSVLGHRVLAPSTLGTYLRSFTWGHARHSSSTP